MKVQLTTAQYYFIQKILTNNLKIIDNTKLGGSLATKNSSSITINPPFEAAKNLKSW